MRGARNSAQHCVAQTRAHTLHSHTHSTATFHSSTASSRPRTTCSSVLCGGTLQCIVTLLPLCGTYLDDEGGEFTTDATNDVAPAAFAAANVCCWLMWLVAATILTVNNLTTVAILAISSVLH